MYNVTNEQMEKIKNAIDFEKHPEILDVIDEMEKRKAVLCEKVARNMANMRKVNKNNGQ